MQIAVGFAVAALAAGLLGSGDPGGSSGSAPARIRQGLAGPLIVGAPGVIGLLVGVHGICWLGTPPEGRPILAKSGLAPGS